MKSSSYFGMWEIVPSPIYDEVIIDTNPITLFYGKPMKPDAKMMVKGFRLKILESKNSTMEILHALNFSFFSLVVPNTEYLVRFPGSEFVDYLHKNIQDCLIHPPVLLGPSTDFNLACIFTNAKHFDRFFKSIIRVTLLGEYVRAI